MLAQLNLFSSLTDQEPSPEKKPEFQTRKLTPPTIIKIEETVTGQEDIPMPEVVEVDDVRDHAVAFLALGLAFFGFAFSGGAFFKATASS